MVVQDLVDCWASCFSTTSGVRAPDAADVPIRNPDVVASDLDIVRLDPAIVVKTVYRTEFRGYPVAVLPGGAAGFDDDETIRVLYTHVVGDCQNGIDGIAGLAADPPICLHYPPVAEIFGYDVLCPVFFDSYLEFEWKGLLE